MAYNRKDGISFVEIILVLVIVGLLIWIAVPRFMDMRRRALATPAKEVLHTIIAREHEYYLANRNYIEFYEAEAGEDIPGLGYTIPKDTGFTYGFRKVNASDPTQGGMAMAVEVGDVDGNGVSGKDGLILTTELATDGIGSMQW